MTGDAPESSPSEDRASLADRGDGLILWATWIGLVVAVVGLVSGVGLALKKRVGPCPEGKLWPESATDHTCYVHPQAHLGVAIAAICLLLGLLVVFASITARASLKPRR